MTLSTPAGLRAVSAMSDGELAAIARALAARVDDADEAARYDWDSKARPNQRWPGGDTEIWLLMTGAGFGKTRSAAEECRRRGTQRPLHIAVVHEGDRDVREICFEHPTSGLRAVIPDRLQRHYSGESGNTTLTLTNGTIFRAFSSNDPDRLRGFAFDGYWCEEFAAWGRKSKQAKPTATLEQLDFRLREATDPFGIITTTPRRVRHMKELVERAKDPTERIVITGGSTYENRANLSAKALARIERKYAGTALGRQEIGGEMLTEVEGALWDDATIEAARWRGPLPPFVEKITVVDASGSEDGDATGIVTLGRAAPGTPVVDRIVDRPVPETAAGVSAELAAARAEAARLDDAGPIVVLADDSTKGPPAERYAAACHAAYRHAVGVIVYESNFGGDNIALGIKTTWEDLERRGEIPVGLMPRLLAWPARGTKFDRAQPVAALYPSEQRPISGVWHADVFTELEEEQTTYEANSTWSPNRLDCLVHGVRYFTKTGGETGTVSSATGIRTSGVARTSVGRGTVRGPGRR